jgi:pseudaminic acid cytidylyltransferase
MFDANLSVKKYCVIPARGGSKRIPNKNISLVNSMPLIAITIENMLASKVFSEILVSTDSLDIAKAAEEAGARLPFMRPASLSDDHTTTLEVMRDFLNCSNFIDDGETVVCIYPTAALLNPDQIQSALQLFECLAGGNRFLISVAKYPHPIQRAMRKEAENRLRFVDQNQENSRTQDLDHHFYDAGQFYIASKRTWIDSTSVFHNAFGFVIPSHAFVDVDYPEDLVLLSKMLKIKDL